MVFLDADTRPAPALPAALVARAVADGLDLLTVGGRFECPTGGLRWLHPALLTTLVYRAAPPGAARPGPVHRRIGNGQCMAVRRDVLLAAGGFGAVAHHTVEDVALVRTMATAGFAVATLDAADLLTVRMYESAPEAWRGWGRSLPLPGVDGRGRRLVALGMLLLAQAAPLWRIVARRGRRAGRGPAGDAGRDPRRNRRRLHPPRRAVLVVADGRRRRRRRPRPVERRSTAGAGAADATRRRAASQNRSPTIDMRPPVAAVRTGPSMSTWATG